MVDKNQKAQSDNSPNNEGIKITAMLSMIDYLIIEMRKISPITAYILDMARKNITQERAAQSSGIETDTTGQQ